MAFDPASLVRDFGDPFAEALACRQSAALFDFSFVARGRVGGSGALHALARLTSRRLDDLAPGRIRYAVRADAAGHLVADLTIWRHADGSFEVMSGRRRDIADLVAAAGPGAASDASDGTAIFAVQGPRALAVLDAAGLASCDVAGLAYYQFCATSFGGADCLVGRLGYTGEAGFEIVAPRAVATSLWSRLAALARPAGFAAADILRIEAGFVLFDHEFRLPVTAADAGLAGYAEAPAAAVAGAVGDVSDRTPLELIAFTATAAVRPVLWQPSADLAMSPQLGAVAVTSACWSPHAGGVLGLGYVRRTDPAARSAQAGLFDPGGSFSAIVRVPRPYIDTAKRRPRANWT